MKYQFITPPDTMYYFPLLLVRFSPRDQHEEFLFTFNNVESLELPNRSGYHIRAHPSK